MNLFLQNVVEGFLRKNAFYGLPIWPVKKNTQYVEGCGDLVRNTGLPGEEPGVELAAEQQEGRGDLALVPRPHTAHARISSLGCRGWRGGHYAL